MALLAHWSTMLTNFLGPKASVLFPWPNACKSSKRSFSVVVLAVAMLLAVALVAGSVASAAAAPLAAAPVDSPLEMRVPNGQFFNQANGQWGGNWLGYTVSDDFSAPFWTAFQRLGGVHAIGYPVSGRFEWKGHITQAFQKLVMQWHPETQQIAFVNVFDELTLAGKDSWLKSVRSTPERLVLDEAGKSWNQVVNDRLSFLDANQAIRTQYFSTPDYLNRYGLPTSKVEDFGNAYVIRLQRAVMQQWKVNRGTEVYYCNARPFSSQSRDLAMMVQAGLMRSLREAGYPAVDRGYKDDSKALGAGRHFFLLGPQSRLVARPSNMPAIIGEGLFVSNDQ